MKHFIALALSLVCIFNSFRSVAQVANTKTDSLRSIMSHAKSDTEKINATLELAASLPCEDSTQKLKLAAEAGQFANRISWNTGVIYANRLQGMIYFNCLHNTNKAFEYFGYNTSRAQKNGDKLNEAVSLETTAKYYEKLGQHEKALAYLEKILMLNPGPDMEMGVLGDMGYIYNNIGDYSRALSAYINSLKLLDHSLSEKRRSDIVDTFQKAGLLLNIGDIYLSITQPGKAFENYNSALKISEKIHDKNFEIWALIGIGKTYKIRKDYPRAVETFEKALNSCRAIGKFKDEGKLLNELANVFLETRETDKALEHALSALKLAEEYDYNDQIPKTYTTLGKIYSVEKDYGRAIGYFKKALTIYRENGELDEEKDTWIELSSAYEQVHQPADALYAYKNYITIRDSVYNIRKANDLTRIDLEFAFSRKQLADSLKQAAIYGKKMERQRVLTYSSYAGLVLVVLLAFFIYSNYSTQKKYNELLSKEKKGHLAHIEAQSNVLTDIARIQSHDVRGPVATILGLVQLYNHDDPADPDNKKVIEGIGSMTEQLDSVVKEVIIKENKLRKQKKFRD